MADEQGYLFGGKLSGDTVGKGTQYFQIGRVKSIVMGPTILGTSLPDPGYQSSADIGKITYELLYSPLGLSISDSVSEPAWPIFGFAKQYPLLGEIVLILTGPSPDLNDKFNNQRQFYFPPYALWGDAHHNAFPKLTEVAKFQSEQALKPGYSKRGVNDVKFPLGTTFVEKDNIKNLRPFEGDTILQSRFGQSIRFGATCLRAKRESPWSSFGSDGDPITIILNDQGSRPDIGQFDSTVENINRDGSAIYMTSTQQIFLEDINSFPLSSFGREIDIITQPVFELTKWPTSNYALPPDEQDAQNFKEYNGG